jgi:hypothetical protein
MLPAYQVRTKNYDAVSSKEQMSCVRKLFLLVAALLLFNVRCEMFAFYTLNRRCKLIVQVPNYCIVADLKTELSFVLVA